MQKSKYRKQRVESFSNGNGLKRPIYLDSEDTDINKLLITQIYVHVFGLEQPNLVSVVIGDAESESLE